MDQPKPKIFTRLVIGVMFTVLALGLSLLILQPERALTWALGMAFLPLAGVGLARWCRRKQTEFQARHAGKLRAGLVGGGVLLATAMLLILTDRLGWTEPDADGTLRSALIFLPALVAVGSELLGDWLSKKAEKD